MKFLKKQINKQQEIEVVRKVKHHAIRNAILIAMGLAALITITGKTVNENQMKVANDVEVTSISTTVETTITTEDNHVTAISLPTVITTTATANTTGRVTTSLTTTTGATTTDVSATERSVVTEVKRPETEPPVEPEPEVIEQPQIEEVHEEVVQEPVYEEPVEEPQPEPESNNTGQQEYYSDDGDHGWSHVAYRYGVPDISADRERYHAALDYVTEEERIYLINVVTSEYGSDYVPLYEKAKVVAVVMNRRNNGYWGDSIKSVLAYPGQFVGYYLKDGFYGNTTPECIDAVDYYFLHQDDSMYSGIMYISGGGGWNSFY